MLSVWFSVPIIYVFLVLGSLSSGLPVVIIIPLDQFTDSLFNTNSYEFSLSLLKDDKGKGVAFEEDLIKELILLIDEGGMEEIKRLEFLKAEKEKYEKRLKVLTPEELEA
ncbi:hypothetical protein Tco_1529794 [Tanacetum coccineum]